MAELASGAVSSLLGVIRNEARLLGHVKGDVQFIQEEMESMNSFLLHLARTAPPGGEHDEQVRTWMNQVRLLAQDCNNCINLYVYRGNPDIQRAKGGLRRYLWWAPWFLQKMVAQHQAAVQLRELKERASDVGKRRLRYGVVVPPASSSAPPHAAHGLKAAAAKIPSSSSPQLVAAPAAAGSSPPAEDDDEDDGGDADASHHMVALATDKSGAIMARFFLERTMEEYFEQKLREWLEEMILPVGSIPSLAIIVSPQTQDEACALARQVLGLDYVLVDIPKVHMDSEQLRPKEILYYILRELELEHAKSQQSQAQQQEGTLTLGQRKQDDEEQKISRSAGRMRKRSIYWEKKKVTSEIKYTIQQMEVYNKLEVIKTKIQEVKVDQLQLDLKKMMDEEEARDKISKQPLGALLVLLKIAAAASDSDQQDQAMKKKAIPTLSRWYDCIIEETAIKLRNHIEVAVEEEETANKKLQGHTDIEQAAGVKKRPQICLHKAQYENILGYVFPRNSRSKAPEQDTKKAKEITTAAIRLDEDQLKEIIDKVKQEILREVLPMAGNSEPLRDNEQANSAAKQAPNSNTPTLRLSDDPTKETKNQKDGQGQEVKDGQGQQGHQIPDSMVEETKEKIEIIKPKIKEQLKIKGIMDRIEHLLGDRFIMIILNTDEMIMDVSTWEETIDALSLLDCVGAALMITTAKSTHQAKRYCYPQWDPIECSLVGLYHATALALTSQKMQQEDTYNPQIFRNILEECKPYEFCMKIFTHALYAKPKRSNKELHELYNNLKAVSPRSFLGIAKKMFKFSYNDLLKEYKTCLLYLAIFPQGHTIRRSTLIGRWVAEGLITNEDWPTSVRQAERCFDGLINRWLIYPADIGATGKVKSCIVGAEVHEFITKIAKKQHILEPRLSHHLARHFSIFNDVQLRASDRVNKFLKRLSAGSSLSLLKVLDLEGCHCFGEKNQRYLKDICSKILLLKYLSLRGTDITQLPNEINNLHELEVLDIRETKVPASTTKHILLLKLKRLLAGHTNTGPSTNGTDINDKFDSVRIPYNIEKMAKMEVLSNVKASQTGSEMEDIRKLYQLRKLGVVIEDTDRHLRKLLRVVSDLHECLQSLSITFPATRCESIPSSGELPADNFSHKRYPSKLLKSLSISGTTQNGWLLPLLAEDCRQLAKVTLSNTSLNQKDLKVLAKMNMLHSLKLQYISCNDSMLTFKKDEFNNLNYFLLQGSNLTEILFEKGATSELKKITLSFTSIGCVSGVEGLIKLEELELNNNRSGRLFSSFDNGEQITKLTLRGTLLEQADLHILAKKPNLRCLVLLDKSCDGCQLTFNKDEFPKLNILIVDCSDITKIKFTRGSAVKLEKIVWTFTNMESLSGTNHLRKLKELEFNGGPIPIEVEEAINKFTKRPGFDFRHNKPENQEQAKGDATEEDGEDARFPFCWKKKV